MTPRPPLNELLALFRATVAREGITTGAGNIAGNTIIDAGLAGVGVNSFISMLIILYPGDFNNVDSADVTVFDNANGEITFDHPYKNVAAAIPIGVPYKIVTFRFVPAEVAALAAALAAHEAAQAISRGEVTSIETKVDDLDADLVAHEAALAAHEAAQAISRAALGTHDTEIKALLATIAGYIDAEVAAIETKLDTPANFMADVSALALLTDTQIRVVQSGVKVINAGITKYLSIDSLTNGAEILSIAVEGVIGHDWTLDIYVPAVDAEAASQAKSKRATIPYLAADTEGGLLKPFAIPFNCFLDFTNDGANDQIDEVTIVYRSRAALTLAWEA